MFIGVADMCGFAVAGGKLNQTTFMKVKKSLLWLLLISASALLNGCETSGQRAGSVDPQFPPAPITSMNAPDNNAAGINH